MSYQDRYTISDLLSGQISFTFDSGSPNIEPCVTVLIGREKIILSTKQFISEFTPVLLEAFDRAGGPFANIPAPRWPGPQRTPGAGGEPKT
jgi:hypothetical protein